MVDQIRCIGHEWWDSLKLCFLVVKKGWLCNYYFTRGVYHLAFLSPHQQMTWLTRLSHHHHYICHKESECWNNKELFNHWTKRNDTFMLEGRISSAEHSRTGFFSVIGKTKQYDCANHNYFQTEHPSKS